jgi:hypothetical protein
MYSFVQREDGLTQAETCSCGWGFNNKAWVRRLCVGLYEYINMA